MAVTVVQAEASQCLFEFLHMEVVSHVCSSQKDSVKKVLGCLSLVSVWVKGHDSMGGAN